MGYKYVWYNINNGETTCPDEHVWTPISPGMGLSGLQKRSPYQQVEWRKTVAGECDVDWFDYDNTQLTSFACPPPGSINETRIYSDAFCQSVTMRYRQGVGNEVVGVFLVNTELYT